MGFQIVADVASFMGRSYEELIFKMTHNSSHISHTVNQAIYSYSVNSLYPTTIVVFSPPPLGRFLTMWTPACSSFLRNP